MIMRLSKGRYYDADLTALSKYTPVIAFRYFSFVSHRIRTTINFFFYNVLGILAGTAFSSSFEELYLFF